MTGDLMKAIDKLYRVRQLIRALVSMDDPDEASLVEFACTLRERMDDALETLDAALGRHEDDPIREKEPGAGHAG